MGKEKGFALSPVRARDMRHFLERHGYAVLPGQHKHLKLRHKRFGEVLPPLRLGDNLSHVAIKQIAHAMGMDPDELVRHSASLVLSGATHERPLELWGGASFYERRCGSGTAPTHWTTQPG